MPRCRNALKSRAFFMDWPVVSSVLFVLVVFGSISPRIVVGSLIDKRIRFDLAVNSNVQHSEVSPSPPPPPPPPPPLPSPPPPPPPMSPPPPPSPWAPPPPHHPKKKKKSNITTNLASHAKGAKHPFNPHQKKPNQKMNIGKKIGLLFAGIAGITQVAVFGFLGFRRWEISKIKDRHDSEDRS